jgi:hypothetical protein
MRSPNVSTHASGHLISSNRIAALEDGEIFVFGSNAAGKHRGGAARYAMDHFGAVYGEGHGLHGQSYAIDTMSGLDTLRSEVSNFLHFAHANPENDLERLPLATKRLAQHLRAEAAGPALGLSSVLASMTALAHVSHAAADALDAARQDAGVGVPDLLAQTSRALRAHAAELTERCARTARDSEAPPPDHPPPWPRHENSPPPPCRACATYGHGRHGRWPPAPHCLPTDPSWPKPPRRPGPR